MLCYFGCFFLAAALGAPALISAQSTPKSAPSPAQPVTTIRTSSDLVIVDVVAADSRQNPVHNLSASDFTVLEDGHPQTIKIFEEHTTGTPIRVGPLPKLDAGEFTNYSPVPGNGALNILLLDKLNTPMTAQVDVRDQVLKYLKEMPPGTRIAIFALTTELHMLQGFTSDPAVLRALLEGKKALPGGSVLMNEPVGGDEPGADDPMMDMVVDSEGTNPDAATIEANLQQFEAIMQSFQLQLRARYTLDALNLLSRYLSRLPGRKNLIWFSGSFPVNILPDPDLANPQPSNVPSVLPDPFVGVASAEDEFRETTDLLARSQVAVYPVDARGLMTIPMMNAANSGRKYVKTQTAYSSDALKFMQQTAEEHGTMLQMAQATGGRAFVNTNGLTEAVERAMEEGSNYYTIAYTPTNHDWNGSFRKIQVKLERPGVTLAYRRGYYADDPNAPARHKEAQGGKDGPVPYSALRAAMLHGAPAPTQLLFVARVRATKPDTEAGLAPGNQVSAKINGPYRRYLVNFIFNPKAVRWGSTDDGRYHCALQFATFVYDVEGKLINTQSSGMETNFTASQYAAAMNSTLAYPQQISVPAKGEYYLRIGIHDVGSDRVGALEVPVATVAKLPPLAQAPAGASK